MNIMNKNMNINDEFYTDEKYVLSIIKYIPKNKIIWCPFDTEDSEYVKIFKKHGYKVYNTHIWNNQDFLTYKPTFYFDIIISNPPYSIKCEIMDKILSYKKPFALLFGVQVLTIRKFMKKLNNFDFQILMYENKLFFKTIDIGQKKNYKTAGAYFHCYYICYNILPKNILLESL